MFRPGDVVRVQPDWLDKGEDPNTDYIVFEDYGDGKVKVFTKSDRSAFGGYVNVWPDYTIYKVGHVNISPDGHEEYLVGNVLSNGKRTVVVDAVSADKNEYDLRVVKPASEVGWKLHYTIAELHGEGYRIK